MYVRFVGAPISGKTTVAARVFAELKNTGQPNVEFVVEQARLFIAERKYGLMDDAHIVLTDEDQLSIMHRQIEIEEVMGNSVGEEGIMVTDSSFYNSLWYMSPEAQARAFEDPRVKLHLETYNEKSLVFLCSPLPVMSSIDKNRLHSAKDSRSIHDIIMATMNGPYNPPFDALRRWAIPLTGPTDIRVNRVLTRIYEKLSE